MRRHRIVTFVIAFAATVALLALPAASDTKDIATSCTYDFDTGTIQYAVTGGSAGQTYTISTIVTGCVELAGTPPDLTGPDDNNQVGVNCIEAGSTGRIQVDICANFVCFATYYLDFKCGGDCTVYQAPSAPSLSPWGLAGLLIVLLGGGLFFVRKRRVVGA